MKMLVEISGIPESIMDDLIKNGILKQSLKLLEPE